MSTAYMGLQLPTVSVTAGPVWASALNAAFTSVDAHDHTSGKGTPVPTAGLLINADLAFGGYNATGLRSARFAAQDATLGSLSDLGCLSNVAGDLYWNNAAGTPVRLTNGGSIVGTAGSISGMDGTSAAASYSDGTGTFTWQQAANKAAAMDVGPLVIRDLATGPLNAVTLASPVGLEDAYTLRLPPALFSGTRLLSVSPTGSTGNMSASIALPTTTIGLDESLGLVVRPTSITAAELASNAVTSAKIAAGAVTAAKLAALGQALSSSCGSYSRATATSFAAITNLEVLCNLTTTRPVVVALQSDQGLVGASYLLANGGGEIYIKVVGPSGTEYVAYSQLANAAVAPGAIHALYIPPAIGLYTFTAYAKTASGTLYANLMKLVVIPQ